MEREPQLRLETATGEALDRIAGQLGFQRNPDETDESFRERTTRAVREQPGEAYKLIDINIIKRLSLKALDAPSCYAQIGVTAASGTGKPFLLVPESQCNVCSFRGHCTSLANHIGGQIAEVVKSMPRPKQGEPVTASSAKVAARIAMRVSAKMLIEQGVPFTPIAAHLRVTVKALEKLLAEEEEDKRSVDILNTRKEEADW